MAFQSLRLPLRFVVPLVLIIALIAYGVVPLVERLTLRWYTQDLDQRSALLATTLAPQLGDSLESGRPEQIQRLFNQIIQDERLYAMAFCDAAGSVRYRSATYPESLGCASEVPAGGPGRVIELPPGSLHVAVRPAQAGTLILVHDMSFVERRSADTRKYIVLLFGLLGILVSLVTVVIAYFSWRDLLDAIRGMLRRGGPPAQALPQEEIQPIVDDLQSLLSQLNARRETGDYAPQQLWTPEKLRSLLHEELAGDEIIVVSNREPYIHTQTGEGITVQRPASGLITAVEPVMQACSGTWIAHGSGSADRAAVDEHDRVQVPPEKPGYSLRRIWLTKEEEAGYYYGFANEGLWPLCHNSHVRPVFRTTDWEEYVKVNQRFADAVVAEAHTEDPVVLVQDYHFALLPRMVREMLPRATIITFWHIPWPNPESFGICPWREEILDGMLGSTILGFHTTLHCQNFVDTVDRYLETRIERDTSTISYGGQLTQVRHYPISIAWPAVEETAHAKIAECRRRIRQDLGLPEDHLLGVGVDRMDYTKGIVERFQAVYRLLELHPEFIGRFSFVQIAAPTRSSLIEYQNLEERIRSLAAEINRRFGNTHYQPIILKAEHHGQEAVTCYYRAANVCMVTSLHDGMNLVAKEFVASRDDERGALVLSQFTGAAQELTAALIVNPYHIEQSANALYRSLTMAEAEQRERMRSMRDQVQDFNIYRWAGRMLLDAARLRQQARIMTNIRTYSRRRRPERK